MLSVQFLFLPFFPLAKEPELLNPPGSVSSPVDPCAAEIHEEEDGLEQRN